MRLFQKIKSIWNPILEEQPELAYNKWAATYDDQPGNPVLDLDNTFVKDFLDLVSLKGKSILDAGCGTGRHWASLYHCEPARLVGYDVSEGMLLKLKEKFPKAETFQAKTEELTQLADKSFDVVISTLALAHIPNAEKALDEWNRVLKPGGSIFITDYHPDLIALDGKRTFRSGKKTIAVKSYFYSFNILRKIANGFGWKELGFQQRLIDEKVRSYYEHKNALHIYQKFEHTPIIYSLHFEKK